MSKFVVCTTSDYISNIISLLSQNSILALLPSKNMCNIDLEQRIVKNIFYNKNYNYINYFIIKI